MELHDARRLPATLMLKVRGHAATTNLLISPTVQDKCFIGINLYFLTIRNTIRPKSANSTTSHLHDQIFDYYDFNTVKSLLHHTTRRV